jgi:myo-inositol 2-dehydrogenase / D-chiro-inositol 1-dehydrogenase
MGSNSDTVTRRDVMKTGGALAAFSIVAPQTVRGTQANSSVSVGLVGSGNRGSYDASIVHADPRARITALCDLFDDRIEMAKQKIKVQNPKVYKDFEKLLQDSSIDAVVIGTPPFEHPRMLKAAVLAGKHIYCEKPMGVDVAGVLDVIKTGRMADPKINISVGFQQRYGPVYLEAYKRIQSGAIGDLVNARAYWISGDPFKRNPYETPEIARLRNWFSYKQLSGDIIVEQDCHNFDVLHWFLGTTPVSAVGYGGIKVRTSMDILDHLSVAFQWPDNMVVNYEANQYTPRYASKVGEEFTGTKGYIEVSRKQMEHRKSADDSDTMLSPRDITYDGIEQFLERLQTGNVENVAERSALSTMIAILGRTAIYSGKEITWKGLYGVYG